MLNNRCVNAVFILVALSVIPSVFSEDTAAAEQLVRLEKRLAELETRLAKAEQEVKEAKELHLSTVAEVKVENPTILEKDATFNILAKSAWRNLRWTQEEQWAEIRKGIPEAKVIDLLGNPPRSVKSLKPRVDKVIYYETSLRDRSNSLRGKISFKDGIVISFTKPNFQQALK